VLGLVPAFDATPLPERKIDAFVLRAVMRAMREGRAIDIAYQSMSRPQPVRRTIEPHALAHDGFCWPARAFDHDNGDFRDFVLGRISSPKLGAAAASKPKDDTEWHGFIDIIIAPHPDLTPAQAQAIAIDYGIRGPMTSFPVRRALLFYALRQLGLDVKPGARPVQEQHIVHVNRAEVMQVVTRRIEA
jgi:predicted DNA-binding transcriptional regulator YafY